jgi:GNAT superfamily N-acetyltransferase
MLEERVALNRSAYGAAVLARMFMLDAERDALSPAPNLSLIAKDGDCIVGFAHFQCGTFAASHAATIRIHVTDTYRYTGVGSKLLRRTLLWADRNGVERIAATPYVIPEFEPSPKTDFFRKHGFVLEGYAKKFARRADGSFADAALMARVA